MKYYSVYGPNGNDVESENGEWAKREEAHAIEQERDGLKDDLKISIGYAEHYAEERDQLRAELERERMCHAGCGVIALANTPESSKMARGKIHPDYMSASLKEVMNAVDREMSLRAELDELKARRCDGCSNSEEYERGYVWRKIAGWKRNVKADHYCKSWSKKMTTPNNDKPTGSETPEIKCDTCRHVRDDARTDLPPCCYCDGIKEWEEQ